MSSDNNKEIYQTMSQQNLKSQVYACNILTQMRNIYKTRQICDVTLIAGIDGQRIKAHRLLLAAASQYFYIMFTGSLKESADTEITLQNIRGEILEKLIDYFYTGRIELCENLVEDIFVAADLLQITDVVTNCGDYLVHRLEASNCLGFMSFAETRSCKKLFEKSRRFAIANFVTVCKSDEFLKLSAAHLIDFIKSDELFVKTEDTVLNSVVAWMEHKPDKGKEFAAQLLELVRFPYLSSEIVKQRLREICMLHKCEQLLAEIDGETAEKWKSRQHKQLIVASNNTAYVQLYDPGLDKWITWRNKPDELHYVCAITALNENLFVIGTCHPNQVSVFTFNMIEHRWSKSVPMKSYRINFCAAILGNYLYIVGGVTHNNLHSDIVERWDINNNIWNYAAVMPTRGYIGSMAVWDDCLYVIGGCNRISAVFPVVLCYNPNENAWCMKAMMQYDCISASLGIHNGVLYILGTRDSNRTYFERYDKTDNQWTVFHHLDRKLINKLSCVLFDDKFLIMETSGKFYSFDPIEYKVQDKPGLSRVSPKLSSAIIPNTVPHLF